jgi:hypothetical protein
MTPVDERLLERLAALPSPLPDPARARRVRARCCTELARRQRRSERMATLARVSRHVIAPVVVALVCVACLVDMVDVAARTLTT